MSLEVPITLAPRYSVSVSLASPTGGALELLPPQTAIVAQLQPILRGEPGPAWPSAGVQAASEAARDAALAAEAQAENAATAASASAGAAAAARTAAEGAATSASGSAATATAQASIASTKAGEAATSASTASTQATAATAQASIASTKATEAAASAAAAASSVAPTLHAGAAKATPDDADEFGYLDSASSWALVKASWAQLKAALKASFDTTYLAKAGGSLSGALALSFTGAEPPYGSSVTKFSVSAGGVTRFSVSDDGTNTLGGGRGGQFASVDSYGKLYGSEFKIGSVLNLNPDGAILSSSAALSWSSGGHYYGANDVFLRRDAASTLAMRNGTNAQTFRLYKTFTDASNYERAFMRWNANVLEIGAEYAGTGTYRDLIIRSTSAVLTMSGGSGFCGFSGGLALGNSSIAMYASAAAGLILMNGSASAGTTIEMVEMTAPTAPAANRVRFYAQDNGAGKTRLMARFATGAAVQIAIEP